MTAIIIEVYYKVGGGHTHMRIFSGHEGRQPGKAGDLCMTNEEFAVFREAAERAASRGVVAFVEE
jgi:hypothetical protein